MSSKIMILFFLSISLPGINWKHCNDTDNGYTCEDLKHGLRELEKIMQEEKHGYVMVHGRGSDEPGRMFLRLFTLCLALATGAHPQYPDEKESQSVGKPHSQELKFCDDIASIDGVQHYNVTLNPVQLLLNPTLIRLYDRLGPAGLHLLMHLSQRNMTSELYESRKKIVLDTLKIKIPNALLLIPRKMTYLQIIEAASAEEVICKIPSFRGFIVNLIRGRAPILCDDVGQSCWTARSYLAGAINPLYPGKRRSIMDIARSNEDCGDAEHVRRLLKIMV